MSVQETMVSRRVVTPWMVARNRGWYLGLFQKKNQAKSPLEPDVDCGMLSPSSQTYFSEKIPEVANSRIPGPTNFETL